MSYEYRERVFSALKSASTYKLLDEAFKKQRMPGLIEFPLTRMERFRTYLPWSWRSNHVTKLIRDPNAPTTFKMRRYLTPEQTS